MQSKVMSKLADSVPVLRKYNVNLDFKAEESPVLTALSGSLAIADDLNNKKDEVVSTSLMTKFKKQNLMWEEEWASDPLKMRDKRYTAKMLETKNAMLQAHLDEIDKSPLSSNVKKKFVEDYGITAKDDFLKLSKTIIEQNNAVELEKLTMVLNDNLLLTKESTSYADLKKNAKLLKKSLDNTSAYKTEEERTSLFVKGLMDATIELDTRDAMYMIAKEPDIKKTLKVIDKFIDTRLSKEYRDDFVEYISKEYGINKDVAERVYDDQRVDLETKLLQKRNTLMEYLEKQKRENNNRELQKQNTLLKEQLELKKAENEVRESKQNAIATEITKLNKSLNSGGNSSYALNKAINNEKSLLYLKDFEVERYFGVDSLESLYNSGKTVSVITDEAFRVNYESMKNILEESEDLDSALNSIGSLLFGGITELSQTQKDILASNLANRGMISPVEQQMVSSESPFEKGSTVEKDFLTKSKIPPITIVGGLGRRNEFARMCDMNGSKIRQKMWNNYLRNWAVRKGVANVDLNTLDMKKFYKAVLEKGNWKELQDVYKTFVETKPVFHSYAVPNKENVIKDALKYIRVTSKNKIIDNKLYNVNEQGYKEDIYAPTKRD